MQPRTMEAGDVSPVPRSESIDSFVVKSAGKRRVTLQYLGDER